MYSLNINKKRFIGRKVVGQEKAIEKVVNFFLKTGKCPLITLLSGESVCGKTTLAIEASKSMGRFELLDCARVLDKLCENRLMEIIEEITERECILDVIILENIDRASKNFINYLVSVLKTEEIVNSKGTKISLSSLKFIATTSCEGENSQEVILAMRNRGFHCDDLFYILDDIIVLNKLTNNELLTIIEEKLCRKMVQYINGRYAISLLQTILLNSHNNPHEFDAWINYLVEAIISRTFAQKRVSKKVSFKLDILPEETNLAIIF